MRYALCGSYSRLISLQDKCQPASTLENSDHWVYDLDGELQGVVFRGAVGRKGGALGEYHARDGPHLPRRRRGRVP
jgi:hypothetical protein